MTRFSAPDGTELGYRVLGDGDPVVCLPGGPMRDSAYLGDLGGLHTRRQLVVLDLRGTGSSATPVDPKTYRCDYQVDDVEALREHWAWSGWTCSATPPAATWRCSTPSAIRIGSDGSP